MDKISRRSSFALSLAVFAGTRSVGQTTEFPANFGDLDFPPFETIGAPSALGYIPPDAEQRRKAQSIINSTPRGPGALGVAQSFVDRFATSDPEAISQWPKPKAWNPLVVSFFAATATPANNDMIAWCAAFANWCLAWAGYNGTNSASSQSFLNSPHFRRIDHPQPGDLVVFTCYDVQSNNSLGYGHVAFVKQPPTGGTVRVVGGNQSSDGHLSIISEAQFSEADRLIHRHINGHYVPCTMRLNGYLRPV